MIRGISANSIKSGGSFMRVIHIIGGGDTGGAKTHVLNLLKELNRHIDARLVCFLRGDFSESAEKMGIPIDVIETGNPLTGLRELRRIIGDEKIDLIHCHGARGNLMGILLKRYVRVPIVTTVHSDYRLDYMGRPAAKLSYGTTYTLALRLVDYYIGVSDPMTDILVGRNFPVNKIYTIYNGIDFGTPIQHSTSEAFYEKVGLKVEKGDVVAGIVARLSPVKDIPTLLRAMSTAIKTVPHLKLVLAGDGEDKEKLIGMAGELGLTDHVCFTGWLQDINSCYAAMDINLLTSISETFPYALTEGTRMKCATIASRVGGVPVLIDDGKNGLIFEPGNDRELSSHLIRLAQDHELRTRMGELLHQKASKLFSIETMVQTQLDIYRSILQREERRKARRRDGVIICGAYGHGNAGDDAILKSIIQSVKDTDENMPITILAKKTMIIRKTMRVGAIYTFNIPKMFMAMRKSLLYINGGGTLIQNITSSRSLIYYLFTLALAKRLKNKVAMYGCGIGPVTGTRDTRYVMRVLNNSVDYITLRDRHSEAELHKFGVTKPIIRVTSDPALVLKPSPSEEAEVVLSKYGLTPNGKYICFLLRSWYGYSEKAESIAACADYAYEKYGLRPVFISMNILYDTKAAAEVTCYMHSDYTIIDEKINPEMLIAVLSHMNVAVAMRLHGLIFSSVSGIPLIGISYDPKINSFLEYLGYGDCINLNEVTRENLWEATDRAVALIGKEEELKQHADILALKEQQNIEAVKELLST